LLRAIAGLPALASLDLSWRRVDAQQLRALAASLPRLRTLALHGCPLSAEEVVALERAAPAVSVVRRRREPDAAQGLAELLGTLRVA
jgi:aminoglycoside phosphotransferase